MPVDTSQIMLTVCTKQEQRQTFSNSKREKTVGLKRVYWVNEKNRIENDQDSRSIIGKKGSDAEHVIADLFWMYLFGAGINVRVRNLRFNNVKRRYEFL